MVLVRLQMGICPKEICKWISPKVTVVTFELAELQLDKIGAETRNKTRRNKTRRNKT